MKLCKTDGCENYTQNPRMDYCATCASDQRKAAKQAIKDQRKFKAKLSTPFVPRKPPKPVSTKRKNANLLYSKRRKKHLDKYPGCQIKLQGCTNIATQIHHVAGRIGSNLTNQKHFKSTCASCHKLLHDKLSAKEAREKGLKI